MPAPELPPPDQDPLEKARIDRNRQQAAFYQKQVERFAEKRSFSKTLLKFVGPVTTLVSVLLAFYTTLNSSCEMERSRDDAAFFKALERMGDKDSAVSRASAADLLAAKSENTEYYDTIRSQFLSSLLLENDAVVLGAVQDACGQLMKKHSDMREFLRVVEEKLKFQVVEPLAGLTLDSEGKVQPLSDERWTKIEAQIPQTGLTRDDLKELIRVCEPTFQAKQRSSGEMAESQRKASFDRYAGEFQTAVLRFRLTKRLLDDSFTKVLLDIATRRSTEALQGAALPFEDSSIVGIFEPIDPLEVRIGDFQRRSDKGRYSDKARFKLILAVTLQFTGMIKSDHGDTDVSATVHATVDLDSSATFAIRDEKYYVRPHVDDLKINVSPIDGMTSASSHLFENGLSNELKKNKDKIVESLNTTLTEEEIK